MDTSDYGRFIERQSAQGEWQGEGEFQLDLSRALAILPQYQLAQESDFLVRLVAAAVASGATQLRVTGFFRSLQVGWDGQAPTCEEMGDLFTGVLSSVPRLSELAVALSTATKLYRHLQVETSEATFTARDGKLLLRKSSSVVDGTRATFQGLVGTWWWPLIRHLRFLKNMVSHCSHAPLNWHLPLGITRPQPKFKGHLIAFGNPSGVEETPFLHQSIDSTVGTGLLRIDHGSEGGEVVLVHMGVNHTLSASEVSVPGKLIWWFDHLPLDMARQVVRGREFRDWCWRVNRVIQSSLQDVLLSKGDPLVREAVQEWKMWENSKTTDSEETVSDRAELYYQGCVSYIRSQKYKEALQLAEKASDDNPDYMGMVAICHGMLGDLEIAEQYYLRILQFDPDNVRERSNYAEDLELMGRFEEAEKQLDRVLSSEPNFPHALALKAKVVARKSPQQAMALAKKALKQPGCPASAWETLAKLELESGNTTAARQALSKFVALANPETLWESNLESRIEEAKQLLESLAD